MTGGAATGGESGNGWGLAVPVVAGVLPLAMWPGLAAPFSTPKLWILAGAVTLLLPMAAWHVWRGRDGGGASVPPVLQFVLVAWLGSQGWSALAAPAVLPEALLLGVAGPLWCLVIVLAPAGQHGIVAAHVAGATLVAVIAVAQAAGVDPFAWLGWVPSMDGASPRMRVYATLGNPNFVAACMAMTLPLAGAIAVRQAGWTVTRTAAVCAGALVVAAMAVTGSRAGAIGLACGATVCAGCLGGRAARGMTAAALVVAALAIGLSGARSLDETARGRVYVWRTTWNHVWDHPVTGVGPGAFELYYPGWERAARAAGQGDPRFRGPQQFAHNDYLQALAERGVPGLVVTVLLLGMPVAWCRQVRQRPPAQRAMLAGGAGAVAACAAIACFDFPLQRPAETATLWMAVALGWQTARSTSPPTSQPGDVTP